MKTLTIPMLCVLVCLAVSDVSATTITVDWSGTGDYTTIQAGIDSAATGDTVLVLVGTYIGAGNRNLDFVGTNLVLMSDVGSATTIVDCEDAVRGFHFHNGEDTTSVVRGFTITDAVADSGAGAFCENGSSPRFEDCVFLSNTAQKRGGGLCCLNSSPIVRDCRFEANLASQSGPNDGHGGGMACLGGSSPLVSGTDFALNQAYYSGGGLYADYSSPICQGCTYTGNNLIGYGQEGAGARVSHSDGTTFTECTFMENGAAVAVVGGGLHVNSSDVTLTDCLFISNTAGNSGGAHFTYSAGGTISGCTFAKNVTTWGAAAAGLNCVYSSNPTITNCTFADNQGDHIWCHDSSPTIEYSILAFSALLGPVNCRDGTETPYIHHCFVYGNADTDTLCGGNFHDIENLDPLFCDMPSGNYTLCGDSPCLAGETWPDLVGAESQGCPACGNAVEPLSWGAIKALYR
ncbi:MAG: right-handed parallel beta-helix repeat-containing protein [Candidatus Eisenbacteria bacterium]